MHTTDAFETYLDHLTDNGFLLLEERGTNEQARYAIYRQLVNIAHVLRSRGCTDPSQHLFIYQVNDKSMDPDGWYTFIVVKKAHLDALERGYFAQWIKTRQDLERGPFRGAITGGGHHVRFLHPDRLPRWT